MGPVRSLKQIVGFITYVLGRSPDEFGLMLDGEGFVKIKKLLQAVCEESGWGFVRRSHLDEILAVFPKAVIQIQDERIRAADRSHLAALAPVESPPRQLFTCIRRKGYAHVLEKGIRGSSPFSVILSDSEALALRMGKRIDSDPVVLRVSTQEARSRGVTFFQSGKSLYASEFIPAGCFSGPALPKEKAVPPQKMEKPPVRRTEPGSFLLKMNPADSPSAGKTRATDGKGPVWKRDRKRSRKEKERLRSKG